MNAKTIFPSKYIKAEDLMGKAVTVQIANMEIEQIGKNKEHRPVLYFRNKEKGLVLNKTNTNKICDILGTAETDEWFGGFITLYPTEVEYAGSETLGIRVKAPSTNGSSPRQPAPPPATASKPVDDDEIPF